MKNGVTKTPLVKGQILASGFEILEVVDLPELEAPGIWARHRKSGAQVFHVYNEDTENLFAFSFSTAAEESTGVAHILEHSVLCGSQAYPCKDAFPLLEQGSLQTYLNAWTFADKTVYPASSVNEQDYFNLMAVYGDSVFRPLLSEFTFMQEGHRLELSAPGEKLSVTGVVYNEMKGAYSSLNTYAGHWSVKSVLPGTVYAWESGGDPELIPALTWEALREFHRRRYSPANCRIFLAGNIPTEKQFDFLDRRFLSGLEPGEGAPPIFPAERWSSPRRFHVPCPAGGDTKATVFVSWLCSDGLDQNETIALGALIEALLGHDGSPLTRVLLESGLGEDISPVSGMDGELRETIFTVGLRGVEEGNAEKVEALILGELKRLAGEGISAEEKEAALLSMEFSHREIRRSHGPFSLVWLRRALRGWLHGAKPWDTLLFVPGFELLKQRMAADKGYLESLIRKYFLDNPHRALVSVEPQADFLEKQEARHAAFLAEKAASLSAAEKESLRAKALALEEHQSREEDPAILASLPHLSRKDLSPEPEWTPRQIHDAGGIPLLGHEIFTNGISYTDMAFPVDIFPPQDYRWLPFFSRAIVSVGLPGMDYGAVSSLFAHVTGGFYGSLRTGSAAPGAARSVVTPSGIFDLTGRDWIVFHLKSLDEKLRPALELSLRSIAEADFSDSRRIRDLVLEFKNDSNSSLAPGGHIYASTRSGRRFSRSSAVEEIYTGLGQIEFAHYLARLDTGEIIRKLNCLRDTLVGKSGLILSFTGSAGAMATARALVGESFRSFGPPRPRAPGSAEASSFFPCLDEVSPARELSGPEVFASPSLRIGFAALSLPAALYNSPEQPAEQVLAHQLSTGALWEEIRMKGGAYGAFANPDSLEGIFSLSTYRDPNPVRSLEAFASVFREAIRPGKGKPWYRDEDTLEKAVIGAYAKGTRPHTGAEKGDIDFVRFLYGLEYETRRQRLERLIRVSGEDVSAVLNRLAAAFGDSPGQGPELCQGLCSGLCPVIVASSAIAEIAAKALGVEPRVLPV
ncbi:MAG: insulinase family protein [Treponema sp.]|jgi:Zn-dependent M16 (insulinase) family peptidase|nr:insulinase family protein [Treponema sp.]